MIQSFLSKYIPENRNLHAIFLMIVAMACFTLVDLLIKISSQTLPVGQVMITLGLGSALAFWMMMAVKGEPVLFAPFLQPALLLRNTGDFVGSISMCLALAYVPISTIGAVIQAVPLMLTAAAALFLGERIGIRRLSAILVGFAGVIFILQPGRADFDVMVVLAVVAAVGLSVRDIGTKLVSRDVSTFLVSFYGAALFACSGGLLLFFTGGASLPNAPMIIASVVMIALSSFGMICVTIAVRIGEMSVVSPFRYSRLLFSLAAGVMVLGEQVNAMMLFGCVLTIGAGLYIWRREIALKPGEGGSGA